MDPKLRLNKIHLKQFLGTTLVNNFNGTENYYISYVLIN